MSLVRIALIAGCVLLVAGCTSRQFPTVPVSGRVTLDGQPLPGARVVFEPTARQTSLAGPGSTGRTDAEGRFSLSTADGQTGAVAGPHRVRITTLETAPDPRGPEELTIVSPERAPPRYNEKSTLTFDVPAAGTDAADFPLVTK